MCIRVSCKNDFLPTSQAVDNANGRLTAQERSEVISECNNRLAWLESHSDATQMELEQQLKIAERACQPAMMKLHGAGGGTSYARPTSGGPRVEEVD